MNILITGGAGFIGSHIVDRYVAEGNKVVVIDNLSTGKKENINPSAEFYQIDVRDSKVSQVFKEHNFDLVNHHAAQMDVRVSVKDPIYDANVNIIGLLNLLENCREYEVKNFVFVSSGGVVYGETDHLPAEEKLPKLPLSPYGVSKSTSEQYLFYYNKIHGMNYTALRYSNVYGPRQNPHGEAGVVAIFSKKLLENEPPKIFGDGEQVRDYIFVEDVVEANVTAAKGVRTLKVNTLDDPAFNVGTGLPTSVNELAVLLSEIANVVVKPIHAPARQGELMRNFLNCDKIRERYNWQPKYDLVAGLRKTFKWFRNNTKHEGS